MSAVLSQWREQFAGFWIRTNPFAKKLRRIRRKEAE
jgi:hypothetical protein